MRGIETRLTLPPGLIPTPGLGGLIFYPWRPDYPHLATAVVLGESRAESGEWVLFDCSNPLCTCDGMMHAECYARLVRGSTA